MCHGVSLFVNEVNEGLFAVFTSKWSFTGVNSLKKDLKNVKNY
jgi:hypothetical protein